MKMNPRERALDKIYKRRDRWAIVWSQKKGVGWHFDEPKTSRSRRTIPLPASTVKALIEHRRRQGEERLRVGSEWKDYGLVFTTKSGNAIDIPTLTKQWFKPALVKAELPVFRLYDLRHTHATLLLSNGENPKVASERLGHSTIVLTLDTVFARFARPARGSREAH